MNARRSWLIVPADDPAAVQRCLASGPDVAVLDLEYSVPPKRREAARAGLKDLVRDLGPVDSEIFVRIDRDSRWADAKAAVVRGIRGIVYPGPEHADEVAELDVLLGATERERGIELGTIELVPLLESAPGFWNIAAIAQASGRVTSLGIGRVDLTMQLGPLPQNEFRLYRYLMTRTLLAARTCGKRPLGAHWRPGSRGGVADAGQSARAAREAKLMGFEGCLCTSPEQVAAVNQGYIAHS